MFARACICGANACYKRKASGFALRACKASGFACYSTIWPKGQIVHVHKWLRHLCYKRSISDAALCALPPAKRFTRYVNINNRMRARENILALESSDRLTFVNRAYDLGFVNKIVFNLVNINHNLNIKQC